MEKKNASWKGEARAFAGGIWNALRIVEVMVNGKLDGKVELEPLLRENRVQ